MVREIFLASGENEFAVTSEVKWKSTKLQASFHLISHAILFFVWCKFRASFCLISHAILLFAWLKLRASFHLTSYAICLSGLSYRPVFD